MKQSKVALIVLVQVVTLSAFATHALSGRAAHASIQNLPPIFEAGNEVQTVLEPGGLHPTRATVKIRQVYNDWIFGALTNEDSGETVDMWLYVPSQPWWTIKSD